MTLYVLSHNERFLSEPANPIWRHYADIAFWLVPHAVAGTCALVLAPLQFSERLRKRYTTAHHIVGRIYVFGALVLAPLGAYGQYYAERSGGPREFTTLAAVDAAMLMTTTLVAYLFAIRRRITQHRQWMTRSYAVALVFFGCARSARRRRPIPRHHSLRTPRRRDQRLTDGRSIDASWRRPCMNARPGSVSLSVRY
jgi:uncharacterized membrane protein